ncbi:YjfB family protein [Paenibacillus sp. 19GGS1-52]|jgi:hypothetical protein|uniref:YjfB family protein n=1 Tax=Paenibacillus sp. 19GGS1-52 TaxID=2758563 RepID=UPI001EFB83E8|nr:YjfB family protein [Paenibacillus sp. 19GGS1-52]ULO08960.1 YjfB family protein [Paenibacillus sp. 19GGS1-52]
MDIAALSIAMSQASLAQSVSVRVFDLAKGQAETQGQDMVKLIGKSIDPSLGKVLDISV